MYRSAWRMNARVLLRVFRAVARAHVRGDRGLNWAEGVG